MIHAFKKLCRCLRERYRNIRIKEQMSLLILFSVFLPLCITLLLFNGFTRNRLSLQSITNSQNAYAQLSDIFTSRFDAMRQDMLLLQQDGNIRTLLQGTMTDQNILQLVRDKALMNTTFDYIQNKAIWDMSIRVYVSDEKKLLIDNRRIFSTDLIADQAWYQQLVSQPYKNQWVYPTDGQGDVFSYVVRVCNPNNIPETLAVIRLDFSVESVAHTLEQSLPLNDAGAFLMTSDGEVILGASHNLDIRQFGAMRELLRQTNGEWSLLSVAQKKYHVQTRSFKAMSWRLMYVFQDTNSLKLLYSDTQWVIIMVVTVATSTVIILLSFLFSKRITSRIVLVSDRMSSLKDGMPQALPASDVHDEVGVLIESYNYMTEELRMLKTAHASAVQNQKHAEMMALQAQINPHFLYNTLEMINYFAMIGDAKQVERIVMLLSRFYKRCLNKGDDYSTLGDELELTKAYCSIQEIRYKGGVRFVQDVPQELMSCEIPHIVLQPIVENAIHHGVMKKDSQQGTIIIRGVAEDGMLHITVADDGAGMTEERLRQLCEQLELHYNETEFGSHFGLRNINERLVSLFGEQAGLSYRSTQNVGTEVTITVPIRNVSSSSNESA